jgi:hypothetical protein
MDKRELHHKWRHLRPIKPVYFLIAALMFLAVGVYGMRQNNLKAIALRDKVVAADKNQQDVEKPLRTLREYVYSHMNTDLSSGGGIQQPIQLKYRYERLVKKEKARVEKANAAIYTRAQKYCEAKFPAGFSGSGRIPCIEQYVSDRGVDEKDIPDALYKFAFVSPVWSPDLAGFSLALSFISFILFIFWWLLDRFMKARLDEHNQ